MTHDRVFDQYACVVDARDRQKQTWLEGMPMSHCASDGSRGHAHIVAHMLEYQCHGFTYLTTCPCVSSCIIGRVLAY